jgi:type III pantothenate kinase
MVLCIDAGNSAVKFCFFNRAGRQGRVHREALTGRRRNWDSVVKSIVGDSTQLQGAVISSVVPKLTPSIACAVKRAVGRPPLCVSANLRFPFRIAVPRPATIGADRLCCAAGAIDVRRTSAILIDIGSAVTVDLVLNAVFKGGIIMTGPALSLRALAEHTEKLPLLSYRRPAAVRRQRFDSTESSLLLGAQMSTLGGIREAVRFLDHAAGRSLVKIITGGAASAIAQSLPGNWRREPHLVLRGLFRLWGLNIRK